jgi:hypothetical protein
VSKLSSPLSRRKQPSNAARNIARHRSDKTETAHSIQAPAAFQHRGNVCLHTLPEIFRNLEIINDDAPIVANVGPYHEARRRRDWRVFVTRLLRQCDVYRGVRTFWMVKMDSIRLRFVKIVFVPACAVSIDLRKW